MLTQHSKHSKDPTPYKVEDGKQCVRNLPDKIQMPTQPLPQRSCHYKISKKNPDEVGCCKKNQLSSPNTFLTFTHLKHVAKKQFS